MIIRIGEIEWHDLQRHLTVAKIGECKHLRLQYIDHGELLKCLDCEKQVSAVWALKYFFTQYQVEKERLESIRVQLKKDEERLVTHKAALAVQDAWRKRSMLPCCPHEGCRKPILPTDGFGKSGVNKELYGKLALPLEIRTPSKSKRFA